MTTTTTKGGAVKRTQDMLGVGAFVDVAAALAMDQPEVIETVIEQYGIEPVTAREMVEGAYEDWAVRQEHDA